MKKVLVISSASVHTLKFINMMENEFEIYIITNNDEMFASSPIKEVFIWKKNLFKNIIYTYKIIKSVEPDLIHIHQVGILAFFYTYLLHKKHKILLTAWGSDVMMFPYKSIFKKWMTRFTLNRAFQLSSIDSIGMASVIKCLTDFKKEVTLVNFGISEFIEFEHNFEKKEKIIYSPRSHKALYNIEMIIHSFATFIDREPEWKLFISGSEDKDKTPQLMRLVNELGINEYVCFLGHVTQKQNAEYMKRSRIVISVPITDGRPISVMEAIASNCIIIASDILANRELVSNGINGLIIDHQKVFDITLYKKIDTVLQTQYNQKTSESFLFKNAKNSFLKMLTGVINDNNRR